MADASRIPLPTAAPTASVEDAGLAAAPSTLREIAVVAALTAAFVLARGYVFGVDDHAIHLAFIERERLPGFLPGDPMLEVASKHPSFLFDLFALLSSWFSLEASYFTAYVLSVFAMLFGLRALARALWPDQATEWVAIVAVAGMFVPHAVGGGIDNFDPLFLPRVASFGPLLLALALCVRGRIVPAFATIGVVFLFHATTAAHTAALAGTACLFRGRERLRDLPVGLIVFLTAASPLLYLIVKSGASGIPTPAPETWIDAVKLHYPSHHFESGFVVATHLVCAGLGIALGILTSPWRGAGRLLAGCFAGGLLLVMVGQVGNGVLRSPITISLHLFQVGRMLDALALLSFGWWSLCCFRRSLTGGVLSLFVFAAYVFRSALYDLHPGGDYPAGLHYLIVSVLVATVLLVAVVITIDGMLAARRAPPAKECGAMAAAAIPSPFVAYGLLLIAIVAAALNPDRSWHPTGRDQPGYTMMRWADARLPLDAVVMIPPYMSKPIAAFRYFGGRRIIGSWKDGGEGTFDLEFQMRWARYMHDAFGDPRRSGDDFMHGLQRVLRQYRSMPAQRVRMLAAAYGATHVVREAVSPPLPFPVLYRDGDYVLYRLPGAAGKEALDPSGAGLETTPLGESVGRGDGPALEPST